MFLLLDSNSKKMFSVSCRKHWEKEDEKPLTVSLIPLINSLYLCLHCGRTAAKFCSRSMTFSKCFLKRWLLISDINECLENTAKCNQYCHNTNGSYFCSCQQGYKLDSDTHTCLGKKLRFECVIVWPNGLTYSKKSCPRYRPSGPGYYDAKIYWQ